MTGEVMDRVRRALGRSATPAQIPAPPAIDEAIARLVHAENDLAELFVKRCNENKMPVTATSESDLAAKLTDCLRTENVRRMAISRGDILDRLTLPPDFEVRRWDAMTLDDVYDVDCGVTPVDFAVAETGSLVVRASAQQGRGISLVPAIHVAVVQRGQIVADLIDLFAKLTEQGTGSAVSIITGPSKTSDIEMNLVVGVHGPTKVRIFLVG